MASIRKRRGTFSVVYTYENENGEKKQRWETFKTYAEAHKRRAEIEYKQTEGTFLPPNKQTVADVLKDYVALYGEKTWSYSTFNSNCSMIANYIVPIIGNKEMKEITPREADKYIKTLQKTQPVEVGGRRRQTEYMTPANIERVIKQLRSAFKQAVRWEVIARNPFDFVTLPKVEKKSREIWTAETIRKALDSCKDAKLFVAMNLAFACSLRVGEILGLTWNNVSISDEDIAKDNASVYVDKELFRASKDVMDTLGNRDIRFVFPPVMSNPKTRLILKTPKTATSVRRVWLPKTLAYILREWRDTQQKQKEFLGDEYFDYDLVVAHYNGRPCDCKNIEKSFNRLKEDAGLPNVVFHSLRHSSTTYKLKLNHGDIKATQGDTGHAQADMITRVYAHILDEDRKVNAQKFESAFYANPDLRTVKAPAEPQQSALDLSALAAQLQQSSEFFQAFAGLISKQSC